MARGTEASGRKRSGPSRCNPSQTRAKRSDREGDVAAEATHSVAAYIADLSTQLESMALAAGLDLAAYFLSMARSECEAQARETAPQGTPSASAEPPSEEEAQKPFDFGLAKP